MLYSIRDGTDDVTYVDMCTLAVRFPGLMQQPREARVPMSDDGALMARVRGGDADAFTELYDRHGALVFGVARRILGNSAQAEDVAQSIFLQIWSKPASFQGGSFPAWITIIARNAAIDVLRSSAVRMRDPIMPVNLFAEIDLHDEVFARLRAAAVSEALRTLPAEQREPIVRAFFGGLSYREVAQSLGAPLGTIKSRIRAGLRRLVDMLREAEAT